VYLLSSPTIRPSKNRMVKGLRHTTETVMWQIFKKIVENPQRKKSPFKLENLGVDGK
jgi:hypothetical protein